MQRPEHAGGAATTGMPLGVSVPAGVVLAVTALFAGATLPAADSGARFGLLLAVVCGFALVAGDGLAVLAVSACAWLLYDGFVVDAFGELAWHGRPDLWRAVALLLPVLAAAGLERRTPPAAGGPGVDRRPATVPVQPHPALHGED